MTNGGNHGGSTYEETDSLALFIGGELIMSDYASPTHKLAFQVIICGSIFFCYSYKIIEYIFFFFLFYLLLHFFHVQPITVISFLTSVLVAFIWMSA